MVYIKKKYLAVLLFLAFINLFDYARYNIDGFLDHQKQYVIELNSKPKSFLGELVKGNIVEQEFECDKDLLAGVRVYFSTFDRNNTSKLEIKVLDSNSGEILSKKIINTGSLEDNAYETIFFNKPIKNNENNKYKFMIESIDGISGNAITLWIDDESTKPGILYVNNEKSQGKLVFDLILKKQRNNFDIIYLNIYFAMISVVLISIYGLFKK